jgi:hypothetical protein
VEGDPGRQGGAGVDLARHSGIGRQAETRNLALRPRDSPMRNCASEVRVFDAPRNDSRLLNPSPAPHHKALVHIFTNIAVKRGFWSLT